MLDNIKQPNISVNGIPEEESVGEEICDEIMTQKFPNFMAVTNSQVPEAQEKTKAKITSSQIIFP